MSACYNTDRPWIVAKQMHEKQGESIAVPLKQGSRKAEKHSSMVKITNSDKCDVSLSQDDQLVPIARRLNRNRDDYKFTRGNGRSFSIYYSVKSAQWDFACIIRKQDSTAVARSVEQ
jgi:hypothetical protein